MTQALYRGVGAAAASAADSLMPQEIVSTSFHLPAALTRSASQPNSLDSCGYLFIVKGLHRTLATCVPGGTDLLLCERN
jgi:hypothetical protein